ncbi:MAG: phosphate acyltransferase PlsX [Candidatus Dependentiae bacterium]|jgi:glycerol-3-phosphate acyltransferase PlsX
MIAVDGLGGDFAPHAVIDAVIAAAKEDIPVLLCGPEKKMVRYLAEQCEDWEKLDITIRHAPDLIGMAEEPVLAFRKKQNSSLVQSVQAVRDGDAKAIVSAGNSGAIMTAALFLLGRQDGIERPAIAGLLPTLKGPVIALDLGANVDCKPHWLYQFAAMGADYAKQLFSLPAPRIALLSNGAERGKGSALVKQVTHLLEDSPFNFVGNVEPIDIVNHCADVIVCDGFSGNVLLKTMEATAHMVKHAFAHQFSSGGMKRDADGGAQLAESVENALSAIEERFGESAHAGARLLGVNGAVIVGHGSAHAESILRSIRKAWSIVKE